MAFIFIRHLPTHYNQQDLLQGKLDIAILPVSAELKAGITANCAQLKALEPFDQILCSPLVRTQQTAQAHGYTAKLEPLLTELDFGPYEGQPRDNMLADIGEQWLNNPASLTLGEPLDDLLKRVRHFFAKYYGHSNNILAFTHGAWMRAARVWHEKKSLATMNQTQLANNDLLIIETGKNYA